MKYQTLVMLLACLAHANTYTNTGTSLYRRQPAGPGSPLERAGSPPPSGIEGVTKGKETKGKETKEAERNEQQQHPVSVTTSAQGKAIIHVYRDGSSHATEEYYNENGPFRKQFSDPKKLAVVLAPFGDGEHTGDATGRKVKGTVEPMGGSRGVATSWSYAAGTKVKETTGERKTVKAASSRVDAPVGVNGYIKGRGVIKMEASNSPSTSPPGSPGRQPPSYPFQRKHRTG